MKKIIAILFTILLSANIAYAEKVSMYSKNNGQTIISKEQKTKQLANITPGQKKFIQAGTLFNNKYYQKTIKNLNEIINNKEDPFFWKGYETDLSCVYQLLGMCYLQLQEYPAAELNLQKAIAIDQRNFYAYDSLVEMYHMEKRFAEAKTLAQKEVDLVGQMNGKPYYNLGASLVELKEYEEAISVADRGLKIAPKSYHLQDVKGYALVMSGKAKEGLPYLEYAAKIRAVPEILFHRGCCYEALGEKALALADFKAVIADNKNYVEEAKEKIEKKGF